MMADYLYEAWHKPPIWMDRVGVRPGEHQAAAFSLVVGAVLLGTTPA